MPLLLWYSCLDTKSTWTSIWSQHAALHVRQPLSQNSLSLFLSLPLLLVSVSLFLSIDILLFVSHWKLFSCDIMVQITLKKQQHSWKGEANKWGEGGGLIHYPQLGADTPHTVSGVFILSLMRLVCMSPALITFSDSLRIDVWGSPSFWTQPVKVAVTGGVVAVRSNYTLDDGWVITVTDRRNTE